MERKEKYYTPSVDEFGINFEYQYLKSNGAGDFWLDDKITFFNEIVENVEERLSEGLIRVKYLDKEDLEMLGFKYNGKSFIFENTSKEFLKKDKDVMRISIIIEQPTVTRIKISYLIDGVKDLFTGNVKNKFEVIKVLKLIGFI